VACEGYLDKVAVAKRLGVKPKTVGEWANQGRLPAYRLGPYLRFKWAEVEAHLAATCRVAAPPATMPHLPSASLATMPRGPLGDC
jgi:excisionase family DNA binding protein